MTFSKRWAVLLLTALTAFSYARAKDELVVRVKQEDDFFGTRIVAGSVWRGTEKLAEGVIYIFMWEGKTPPELK